MSVSTVNIHTYIYTYIYNIYIIYFYLFLFILYLFIRIGMRMYAKKNIIIIVQALRQSVLNGSVSAESLVSMSSTQLATHELLEKVFLCLCMYVCMYHIYMWYM